MFCFVIHNCFFGFRLFWNYITREISCPQLKQRRIIHWTCPSFYKNLSVNEQSYIIPSMNNASLCTGGKHSGSLFNESTLVITQLNIYLYIRASDWWIIIWIAKRNSPERCMSCTTRHCKMLELLDWTNLDSCQNGFVTRTFTLWKNFLFQ